MQLADRGNGFFGKTAKRLSLPVGDGLLWGLSLVLALFFRYEFSFDSISFELSLVACLIIGFFGVLLGASTHLYRGRFIVGSLDELRALTLTAAFVAVLSSLVLIPFGLDFGFPRSTGVLSSIIFLVLAGLMRLGMRQAESKVRMRSGDKKRAIVYGAGEAAELVVTELLSARGAGFLPVALIDDSVEKKNRWIRGVPMMGRWSDLPEVARKSQAAVVIVAIPSADSSLLRKVYEDCRLQGLQVVVLPPLHEFLSRRTTSSDLRDISIEDLVGRDQRSLRSPAIEDLVRGKRIVVTGAGGSIGSELARQLARLDVSKLYLVDRDESALLEVGLGLDSLDVDGRIRTWLMDIRDEDSVSEFFRSTQIDIVFHAAALKHVTFLEEFPSEAWKTNVQGTLNVLRAASSRKVSVFVNISTDKAANATTVLGRSKALAEQLTAWYAAENNTPFVSVRFGNVLGSRGSLIPIFAKQIEAGGPITVTDKRATRYFMSISEACQLVLQAATEGVGGDVLLLDMGEPVSIQDIAERMVEISGRSIDIVYTGLRPGEKLHEDLLSDIETAVPSSHPKILRLSATPKSPDDVWVEKW